MKTGGINKKSKASNNKRPNIKIWAKKAIKKYAKAMKVLGK